MSETLTDRSRQIDYQECPRRRYLGYHYPTEVGRIGVRRVAMVIPLATGIYTHLGLRDLLSGSGIESAVEHAVSEYWEEIERRGLIISPGEDSAYAADEQCAWVEGTLRAYEKVQLPDLLQEYDIVDVEKEIDIGLEEDLVMMTRRDALLRHRESGDLIIQSYKTAAQFDGRTQAQGEHDVQGLSEAYAHEVTQKTKVAGIRMEYLLKGVRREYPKDSGRYVQYSPLTRGYIKHGVTSSEDEFGWKREWTDASGKDHRLDYRSWVDFNTWKMPGGVKAWVDLLARGEIQPEAGDALKQQFVVPRTYWRQEDDLRDWYEQTSSQEQRIKRMLEIEPHPGSREHRSWLNDSFPQHRQSCDWPSACVYQDICYSVEGRRDPLGGGLYEPRVPHHIRELVQVTGIKTGE